jgi:hypothetical protein
VADVVIWQCSSFGWDFSVRVCRDFDFMQSLNFSEVSWPQVFMYICTKCVYAQYASASSGKFFWFLPQGGFFGGDVAEWYNCLDAQELETIAGHKRKISRRVPDWRRPDSWAVWAPGLCPAYTTKCYNCRRHS